MGWDPRTWSAQDVVGGLRKIPGVGLGLDALGIDYGNPSAHLKGFDDISSDLGAGKAYDEAAGNVAAASRLAEADRLRALNFSGGREIRDVDPYSLQPVGYNDASAPTQGTAYDAGVVSSYRASNIDAPEGVGLGPMADVQRVQERQIGAPERADVVNVQRTELDTSQSDQMRGRQERNLDALEAATTGPSAAAQRLDAALAKVAQQQMGAASAARGSERAGARREAMLNIGEQGFEAAKEGAALELEERARAREALAGALGNTRGQDIDQAGQAAQLTQQANLLQAEIQKALAEGNAERAQQLKIQQSSLLARADEINAGALNDRATTAAELRLRAAEGNAGRGLTRDVRQAELDTEAMRFGAEATNLRGERLADRRTDVESRNLDRGITLATTNADRRADADARNSEQWLDMQKSLSDARLRRDVAEGDRLRGDFSARENAAAAGTSGALQGAGQTVSIAQGRVQGTQAERDLELKKRQAENAARIAREQQRQQGQTAGIEAIGAGVKAYTSLKNGGK